MTGLVDSHGRLHAMRATGAVACPSRVDLATSTATRLVPRTAKACCRYCLIVWSAAQANRGRGPIANRERSIR